MRLCASISIAQRHACEPGIAYRRALTEGLRARSRLEHERDGTVVDELDVHVRAEAPALRLRAFAKAFVQQLRLLCGRGGDEARAVAAGGIAVERELAHAQYLAITERLVHSPVLVGEHAQRSHLGGPL